jgi:hypothetical protein
MEKRRTSGRHRAEPPSKRRVSTPVEQKPPPSPSPPPPEEPEEVEEELPEELPYVIDDDEPLPVLPVAQDLNLNIEEFQSIAERYC